MKKNYYGLISGVFEIRKSKFLKRMRIVVLLVLITVTQTFAVDSYGQSKRLSINLENETITNILENIEDQSEFYFMFDASRINVSQRKTVDCENQAISNILDQLFENTGITYSINDRQILLTTTDKFDIEQQKSVSGKVTDSSGAPLPGVTVVFKGTTQGTVTNADGEFSLSDIPVNATLQFSFVGMRTQEIVVGGQTVIDVKMEEDAIGIEEVVAIGYGTQKRINLTGAVNSVSSDEIEKRQVGQSSMLLQGIVPGVTVTQSSGQPGNDGGTIRIRGIGTLNDANPLVLVDGIPMDINNIDPNLIESVSVLKDAASASIYGARAANGVILVTTKRASNNKFSFNYSNYFGISAPTNLKEKVNAEEHMTLLNLSYKNIGSTPLYSEDLISSYSSLRNEDPLLYPDTDWFKEVFTENGFTQNHSLSFEGGNEKIKVLGALGYYNQGGIIKNTGFDRYSFRLNTDMKINTKLAIKADVFFQLMKNEEPGSGIGSVLFNANHLSAIEPTVYPFGYAAPSTASNPLAMAESSGYTRTETPSFLLNIGFVYDITKNLSFEFTYSPHIWEDNYKRFRDIITVYYPSGEAYNSPSINSLAQMQTRYFNNNLWATINYEKDFNDHNLKVLLGASQEDYSNRWFSGFRDGFDLPQYDVLNAGDPSNMQAEGSGYDWALQSLFGRLNYNFKNRYLVEANFRFDGSSRFLSGNKFGFFPSFSSGWRISEENFWSDYRDLINNLKIRFSWGQLGNQNIGYYPYDSFLETETIVLNEEAVKGLTVTDLANSNISWETTEMLNLGIDVNVKNFNASFDYYHKTTNGILLQLDIPAYLGVNAPYQNAGIVKNNGWDFSVGYNARKKDLSYGINLSLSDVKNKIVDLKGANVGDLLVNFEGYAINSFYGYEAIGYFTSQEDIDSSPAQTGTIIPGSIKYKDQDDSGAIDGDDRKIIGNNIPRYTFSINGNLKWKNIDFSMLLQGVGKVDGYLTETAIWPFSNGSTALTMHKDYWTKENPNASFPSLAFNNDNNYQNSTFWLKDASYLRVKNIQIGYSFSSNFLNKANIRQLRFYVSGQNLLTLDNFWDGFDAETPVGNATYYPQQKSYSIGVNISF
ncbi:TonB-dependent receptor [Maribellus maritimus]|uniref:TonB-dependent receptor n=1 Tax=Maribellus maritimus TaxID=2870838 RepID=UPI001EEB600F|nr:TonB-dependent receptor [Maribellus maritimus]MCG6189699.1 TonB-dependent receptor [Maribellus maritimus]